MLWKRWIVRWGYKFYAKYVKTQSGLNTDIWVNSMHMEVSGWDCYGKVYVNYIGLLVWCRSKPIKSEIAIPLTCPNNHTFTSTLTLIIPKV